MTLPDCKDNIEDNDGITDKPPLPSHSEAYSLINKLTMDGGIKWLLSHLSAATPQATAEHGDVAIYKTYAVPRNKILLLTNAATQHARGHCSFDIIMNKLNSHE